MSPLPSNVVPLDPHRKAPVTTALEDRADDDLMLLARGGMGAAFDVLVQRHQGVVLSVALRQVNDPVLAKDVAQNTFLEIHRYLPRYQPQGKFPAFMHRVLHMQCRLAGRRRQHARSAPETIHDHMEVPPAPEEVLLRRERRRVVDAALQGLSDKLRSVVVLRFVADLSHQEISDVLDIPVGTVKSRLFAGVEELRKRMNGVEP